MREYQPGEQMHLFVPAPYTIKIEEHEPEPEPKPEDKRPVVLPGQMEMFHHLGHEEVPCQI